MKQFAPLTNEQIEDNFGRFIEYTSSGFPSRKVQLMQMYEALELKIATAPASSTGHFHNAFPGGFLDHTFRVVEFAYSVYDHYKSLGIDVGGFIHEELGFAAVHHDFGKLGFPGDDNDRYVPNTNDWSRNRGVMYESNDGVPFSLIQHQSLFLLQSYSVPLSWNEYEAILIHDGLYEEGNKPYWVSNQHKSRLRTVMPMILHQADMMASQFEYDRWTNATDNKLKNYEG